MRLAVAIVLLLVASGCTHGRLTVYGSGAPRTVGELTVHRIGAIEHRWNSVEAISGPSEFRIVQGERPLWLARCATRVRPEVAPLLRHVCRFDPASDGLPPVTLAVTGASVDRLDGYVVFRSLAWPVRPAEKGWTLTGAEGEVLATGGMSPHPLELRATLAPGPRRVVEATIAGLTATTLSGRWLFLSPLKPPIPMRTVGEPATESAFVGHARRLAALGREDLAAAVLAEEGAPLDTLPPLERRARANRAYASGAGARFAIGGGGRVPARATDVAQRRRGRLLVAVGIDFSNRLELEIGLGLSGRAFDAADGDALVGVPGTLEGLDEYVNRRGATNSSGAFGMHLGVNWVLFSGPLAPYVGVLGGFSAEAHRFTGEGGLYDIDVIVRGLNVAPRLGARWTFFNGPDFGMELRVEAAGHFTFYGDPVLEFEGDVSDDARTAYSRLGSLSWGDPAFEVEMTAALAFRYRFIGH